MSVEKILFVTGKLAEPFLRRTVEALARRRGFQAHVQVLPISVAALMTTEWIARRLPTLEDAPWPVDRVVLPGYCRGEPRSLAALWQVPVELGPRDLARLPEHFGESRRRDESYGEWDIEILAEINLGPRWEPDALLAEARRLADAGADVIDLGCEPGSVWADVGTMVRRLRDEGHRVSIDSRHPAEIRAAVEAGAELVLSLDRELHPLVDELDVEWVVVPDVPHTLEGVEASLERVRAAGGRCRLDPILDPIGLGMARSLGRYLQARDRFPDIPMMMGIGNVTELTDVDSAGVNAVLLGFCQEVGIRSVLTTQVINWARTAVRECDVARRLMHYAVRHGVPPKRLDERLVMLRDARVETPPPEDLTHLAGTIRDRNYRLFVADGTYHLVTSGVHLQATDPFELFDQLADRRPPGLDASHAFYLGYELSKAEVADTLGKQYRQDEALDWGLATRDEPARHRLKRRIEQRASDGPTESE